MMISVCMITYNGEVYIKEQIESILKQLRHIDEVIISDDGSTDSTLAIIRSFDDSRIKIFKNDRWEGSSKYKFMYATRNMDNALRKAKGDLIFLADQDDIWDLQKVEIFLNYFKTYDLICSDCTIVDEKGKEIKNSYFLLNKSSRGFLKNILNNSYLGCCMAFKKELLNEILPMAKFNVPHDIWIGLLAELFKKVHFADEKLVRYRRHNSNLSASAGISDNSLLFKIQYRFSLFFAIIKRVILLKFKQ